MTPSQKEALLARRDALAEKLAEIRALPVPVATGKKRDPAKAWLKDIEYLERMLSQIDGLMGRNEPKFIVATPTASAGEQPPTPSPKAPPSTVVDLARIPKGKRAEMRVSVKQWKGRRTVDIRLWFLPEGGSEWVPSRKGVSVDSSKMPALLDALHAAAQHTPQG